MEQQNVVRVVAGKDGSVITVNQNKPKFGYVQVVSTQFYWNKGFLVESKRRALISGEVTVLEKFGLAEGKMLPGKIVIKESLVQGDLFGANVTDEFTGIKYASGAHRKAGLAFMLNDQPIYRKSYYTPDLNEADVLIGHDNSQQIADFTVAQKAAGNEFLLADWVAPVAAPKVKAK